MSKTLQSPERIVQSLLALRDEIAPGLLGKSGQAATILMKINSCLYSEYPVRGHGAELVLITDIPEAIKDQLGDVDCLAAPSAGDKLNLMPYPIDRVEAWKVNQGFGLIIPKWPPDGV